MTSYKNIKHVETLDDGTMNVLLRNGKKALIEIQRLNEKFEAAVYHMMLGDPVENGPKTPVEIFGKLTKHDAYKECAKEALGWVDENTERFLKSDELGSVDYK